MCRCSLINCTHCAASCLVVSTVLMCVDTFHPPPPTPHPAHGSQVQILTGSDPHRFRSSQVQILAGSDPHTVPEALARSQGWREEGRVGWVRPTVSLSLPACSDVGYGGATVGKIVCPPDITTVRGD